MTDPTQAEMPVGMKPWHGGSNAPYDWDGGPVLYRDGQARAVSPLDWWHGVTPTHIDIIAYTPKPSTPVQSAGEAFHETGVSLKVAIQRVLTITGCMDLKNRGQAEHQIATCRSILTAALSPPAPASVEADRGELDEMLATWRASLANSATWMQRLRGLLSPAPASVAKSPPSATDGVEAETGERVTQAGVADEAAAREILADLIAEDDTVWRNWLKDNPGRLPRVTADECIAAMLAFAARPAGEGERIDKVIVALEQQMETQDEHLPSSLARERGLVWLDGWFDLRAALATEGTRS